MKDNALISVRGLEKSFGKDIQVLKGIDIDIFKGDVVVVLGPSGSGKSTFLRCLNRLEERRNVDLPEPFRAVRNSVLQL